METTNTNKQIIESYEDKLKSGIMLKRIKDHIERVIYFYAQLAKSGIIPEQDINYKEVLNHDLDKLEPENLVKQCLRLTDGDKLSDEDIDEINAVVRKHVKTNRHHCEYWGKSTDDHNTIGVHCEKMPDRYIYEMMADWASTAEEKGTKIIDWYNKCVDSRWFFSEHQKNIMLKSIEFLDKLLEPMRKRHYGFKYIDPAKLK